MRFDYRRDAISRLEDTTIFYQGKAFYVQGITEDIKIIGQFILTKEQLTVDQEDPDLNMSCPEVGFVNTPAGAFYFMRQPVRRWKQGIDFRALVCPHAGIRPRGLLTLETLAECLENKYPSFRDACSFGKVLNPFKQEERVSSRAFCKTFSVHEGTRGLLLNYKGREVGVVENGNPILATNFRWLQESLESVL